MGIYRHGSWNNVFMGPKEAQKLPEGVWGGIPQRQKGYHPIYPVNLCPKW